MPSKLRFGGQNPEKNKKHLKNVQKQILTIFSMLNECTPVKLKVGAMMCLIHCKCHSCVIHFMLPVDVHVYLARMQEKHPIFFFNLLS